MSKYSKEEIQARALFLLGLKKSGNIRYTEFCIKMMLSSGATMDYVENKIVEYSKLCQS